MALRKSSVLTGFLALGFSCWVTALGLGELTLHSALDEPFNAEIELVNVGDADENQIFVGLASKEDFERAGAAWEFHLLKLKFKTDLSDVDHPVIKVSSKESIKEPYLDFVAQLEWPSGRLLREYTLFLDLPVFDTNKAAPATDAAVSSAATKKSSSMAKRTSSAPAQQASASGVGSTTGGAQYRVKGGDTLWKVASRTELEATTVYQRMVAIHAANPEAFVNGNANLLKKGAVLRMPDLASAESINRDQARQVVADQSRAWNEEHKQSAVRELIGDVPVASKSAKAESQNGLLRLSTPTAASTSSAQQLGRTAGSEGSSASSEVLQNELGIAQEELDRSKRENLELKAKLAGLEAQLNTTSKLLELESDDLKAVQLGVTSDKETEQDTTAVDSEAESGSSEADATATAAVEPSPVITDSAGATKGPLSGLFTFVQSNWMPLVGFVVVLLGVLLLVAKSKKEDEPEQVEPFLSTESDSAELEEESAFEAEAAIDEPLVEAEFTLPESEELAPMEVVEEVDPLGEADIYLSLGNFSEAESVIEKAIEAAPSDSKLHLKRLDLFAAQQDAKGFDAYYPTLVALGDTTATATADRLRANIQEEAVVEAIHEPTLEEQVAEELGIDGLELDLSDALESQSEPADDVTAAIDDDLLSAELEADLESSFLDSDESEAEADELVLDLNESDAELDLSDVELDLSEMELDLKPAKASTDTVSEAPDEDLEDALFGDISLPDELDELSADISADEASADLVIELPDVDSDEFELPELASDEIELPDLSSFAVDQQDTQLDSAEDEGLELSLDSFDFDGDDDLDLELGEDESNTQLELAQAYVEMGDESGAKDILAEVLNNGSDEQKQQANDLLAKLS
ncbi:MAG: hypothetical protein KBT88_10685 [Gammaproteobacteria bacterium]|nr:hypothetical protein [Gammaproteobacteria bacterium]MBQ0840241.1 hypothetical protein [Gammaproteobacteria bacterium]